MWSLGVFLLLTCVSSALGENVEVAEITASSTYQGKEEYSPLHAIDGKLSHENRNFLHTKKDAHSWAQLKLSQQMVCGVELYNRADCCGERLSNLEIRAGLEPVPAGTTGHVLLTQNERVGFFAGPGENERAYKVMFSSPKLVQFITFQLMDENWMNLNEVKVIGCNTAGREDCDDGCEFNPRTGYCMCPKESLVISETSCVENERTKECGTQLESTGGGGCFPATAFVTMPDGGKKQMKDLQVGELVLTESGNFNPILGWLDIHKEKTTTFLQVSTNQSSSLSLTPSHVLFRYSAKQESQEPVYARDLEVGDILIHEASGKKTEIIKLVSETKQGYYSPLTATGTIIVNNFKCSCYAGYPHHVAHAALFPARTWPETFLGNTMGQQGTGAFVTIIKRMGDILQLRD